MMRLSFSTRIAAGALVVLGLAREAGAQGSLSTQGYGYPPGQLSTRANGMGGSIGEDDAMSMLNPASLAGLDSKLLTFQIEPEYRRVTSGATSRRSSIARYPLTFAAIPIGEHVMMSIGASTLLDRTWATQTDQKEVIGTDTIVTKWTQSVEGAMNDLRLAAAWTDRKWIRLGVGAHAISGRNLVSLGRTFPASSNLASFTQERGFSLAGAAFSAGAELTAAKYGAMSLAYRHGARVHAVGGDTLYGAADAPNRFGFGLTFTRIAGTTLAFRAARDGWSSLASLGSSTATPVDTWDTGFGAEVAGPKLGRRPIAMRAGVRQRTLPYEASGNRVTERSLSLGTGLGLAGGRVLVDLAAMHAFRDAGLSVKERAWTFSIGLSARP